MTSDSHQRLSPLSHYTPLYAYFLFLNSNCRTFIDDLHIFHICYLCKLRTASNVPHSDEMRLVNEETKLAAACSSCHLFTVVFFFRGALQLTYCFKYFVKKNSVSSLALTLFVYVVLCTQSSFSGTIQNL